MMRAVIYARFSTDLQNERSIDDQTRLCRDYCEKRGLTIAATYEDRARSGASMFGRDGLLAMMDRAREGAFEVVVVEALDRLSRDMEDLAGIHKRLAYAGIELRAVHEGRADTVTVGLRGLVAQLYREDGAKKVKRGMAGVIRDGRHAGGRAYGYRPIAGKAGEMEIVEAEAEVVRRIFADYAAGASPRDIAGALNREKIAPPRGRMWNASTINGSRQRANGILQNELYAGTIVWNRVRMVKDPDTGRRVSRANPADEWQSAAAGHLKILDDQLLAAVRERRDGNRAARPEQSRRPRHLLSGLLKCGCCGSGMSIRDRDKTGKTRVRCSAFAESGACDHSRVYYLEAIERVAVEGLRDELRDPRLIAEFAKTYQAERIRLARDAVASRSRMEQRRDEAARALGRLVDALAEGRIGIASIRDRLIELETEKAQLDAELAQLPEPVEAVALHPMAIARYLDMIEELSTSLQSGADIRIGPEAERFRALVNSVIVHPVPPRTPLDIELRGYLAELAQEPKFPPHGRYSGSTMVAEEGLEPPTQGL